MSLFNSGVRPAIDEWLLNKSKELRDYGDYWSASSAGYCQRKLIFERLGVPHVEKEDDARKQRIFTSGHLFHSWIQGITKETGLSIAQELELQDEDLMIRGHIDDLVLVGETSEPFEFAVDKGNAPDTRLMKETADKQFNAPKHLILYDYKTVNSRAFGYKDKLSHYHKLQLATYMLMLRKELDKTDEELRQGKGRVALTAVQGHDLTESRILLISKDDLRMKEQQLLWDTQLNSDVVSYWTSLNDHWKNKTLPKCTCADHENGFLAKEKWNPFWFEGSPCSLEWYKKCKKEGLLNVQTA
jgi:hypothetical protein